VHDGTRSAAPQKLAHQFSVSDVSMYEGVPRIGRNLYQIAEIPGVGKLVKIHHRSSFGREPLQNEVGTNKTGSSGHQNGLVYFQDRKPLAGDFFQQLLIDIEVGVNVLHVVMLFERLHQPDHGARRRPFQLDVVLRNHSHA
jgi:hypothetical protein